MSYDGRLAERVRMVLATHGDVVERRMMGALCFMSDGHMCCGVTGSALMIRVGRDAYEQTLTEPHVKPMEIGNRRATGFVPVDAGALRSDTALADWILRAPKGAPSTHADPK